MFRKILTFLIFTVMLLAFPKLALGFGITPAEINVQNLKPGGHYETDIYVTRPITEVDEDLRVVLEPDLGEMESWFKFVPGSEFLFPTGKNTTSFKVVIDVPQNVTLQRYQGVIRARGESGKRAREGVTMLKGAVLGVTVVASEVDVFDLEVLYIKAPDVNSGDPVRLLLNIENKGNAAVSPDSVNLEVMDLFGEPLENLSDTTLEKIDPFSTKEIRAEFDSNLEKGQYRVDASVIFMGEEIARKKMVLTVNAKPARVDEETVAQPEFVRAEEVNYRLALALIALGGLLLVAILLIVFKKADVSRTKPVAKLAKAIQNNKTYTWIGIILSLLLVAVGLYLYLISNRYVQVQRTDKAPSYEIEGTSLQEEEMALEEASESTTGADVRGISIEADQTIGVFEGAENGAGLIVERPGTPGLYPIFENPSFDSEITYEAEDGETFDVRTRQGDWYNVFLEDGTSGWLHKTSIKK